MTDRQTPAKKRETFTSDFGLLMTMVGVAVGLGAVWRFPYMVGKFGGAAFVLFYMLVIFLIAIPTLMAEWVLGRHTRRVTLGAFERGKFPGGRGVGYFLFFIVFWATEYYSNALGLNLRLRYAGTGVFSGCAHSRLVYQKI